MAFTENSPSGCNRMGEHQAPGEQPPMDLSPQYSTIRISIVTHARDNRPTVTTLAEARQMVCKGTGSLWLPTTDRKQLVSVQEAIAIQAELYAEEKRTLAATGHSTLAKAGKALGKDDPRYKEAKKGPRRAFRSQSTFPGLHSRRPGSMEMAGGSLIWPI